MRTRTWIKLGVTVAFGLLWSSYVVKDDARLRAHGRDAFLAFESQFFDNAIAGHGFSHAFHVFFSALLPMAVIGAYEGILLLVGSLMTRHREE